jgi:DtxR family Mn-dependent transcriptional regulator
MRNNMRISECAQELLEELWLAQEGGHPGIEATAGSDQEFNDLQSLGLVENQEQRWMLTESGREEASKAIRRHRLGERLMADVFDAHNQEMEEHACRLEHALLDGLDESICTLLGHPQFCPHGKPIPPGECCRQMRAKVDRLIAPLNELREGKEGKIAYLQMNHPARLQKLMAMGVLPGEKISLLRSSPSYVFEVGYSQFAVDEEIASAIYVRLAGE